MLFIVRFLPCSCRDVLCVGICLLSLATAIRSAPAKLNDNGFLGIFGGFGLNYGNLQKRMPYSVTSILGYEQGLEKLTKGSALWLPQIRLESGWMQGIRTNISYNGFPLVLGPQWTFPVKNIPAPLSLKKILILHKGFVKTGVLNGFSILNIRQSGGTYRKIDTTEAAFQFQSFIEYGYPIGSWVIQGGARFGYTFDPINPVPVFGFHLGGQFRLF